MDEKERFWHEITTYLKDILSLTSYTTWVEPASVTRLGNQSISIAVPNSLTKSYWERHLAGYILQYSLENYGVEYEPTFIIVPEDEPESLRNKPDILASDNEYFSDSQLNPNYTFENFVIGEDNKMAGGAALAVCDGPGKTYNPFLIYGGVGLGKPH